MLNWKGYQKRVQMDKSVGVQLDRLSTQKWITENMWKL